jgi:3-oxo-5-alpha-steroid 4-dehydrogenase 3 / polyprenol reductase
MILVGEVFQSFHALIVQGYLQHVLVVVWVSLTVGSLLTAINPNLKSIARHGKMNETVLDSIDQLFFVPKQRFIDFYIVGIVLSVSFSVVVVQFTDKLPLLLILFAVHNARRLWECNNITDYGESSMHIAGYIVGCCHYCFANVTLLTSILESDLGSSRSWCQVLAIIIFFCGNILQLQAHYVLFTLKQSMKSNLASSPQKNHYSIPFGGMFDYCFCPHYFAEILIYFSFVLFSATIANIAMLVWVICNLSVVGYNQYCWYLEHCFDDFKKRRHVFVIFPLLW